MAAVLCFDTTINRITGGRVMEVLEGRRVGGEHMGRRHPIVWINESNDKKITTIKYMLTLNGCW